MSRARRSLGAPALRRPNTSKAIRPIFVKRSGDVPAKRHWGPAEHSRDRRGPRSHKTRTDQTLPVVFVGAGLRRQTGEPGDRDAAVEHLHLAPPAHFLQVFRQVSLQLRNRHVPHKTILVMSK